MFISWENFSQIHIDIYLIIILSLDLYKIHTYGYPAQSQLIEFQNVPRLLLHMYNSLSYTWSLKIKRTTLYWVKLTMLYKKKRAPLNHVSRIRLIEFSYTHATVRTCNAMINCNANRIKHIYSSLSKIFSVMKNKLSGHI